VAIFLVAFEQARSSHFFWSEELGLKYETAWAMFKVRMRHAMAKRDAAYKLQRICRNDEMSLEPLLRAKNEVVVRRKHCVVAVSYTPVKGKEEIQTGFAKLTSSR